MMGLNATLSLASEALSADSGALALTNNNIANVSTPGYSREVANLSAQSLTAATGVQENGVLFNGFTSVRDEVLQIAIQGKTADAASLNTQSTSWSQIESGFSSSSSNVGTSISSLFSALSSLATAPSNSASRQSALAAAGNLAEAFQQAAATLTTAKTQANSNVTGTVANINELAAQIASLDQQLASIQGTGQDGGSVEDQRDSLTAQLAGLIGINSTATQTTPSLSTVNGSALVVGGTACALTVTQGLDGATHVLDSEGQDITSSIVGGSLGGDIRMRDTDIPQVSSKLDQFATQLATAMNAAQAIGYDANGNQGQALFELPTDGSSAAAGISLALGSASQLALGSDGSAGSSGNLANLLAVQSNALPSGQTPTDTYASLVESIGDASSSANSSLTAANTTLTQLTNQQASESGVSVDEETTNLLRYQQAYSAAAQVVTTVNSLFSVLLNMGGEGA